MATTERVYKSRDNKAEILVAFDDSATPLQGVTRITCELQPAGVTIDSDVDATAITWQASGEVVFDFGAVVAFGTQTAELVAYDPGHPGGQTLAHPNGDTDQRLVFVFVE